MPRTFVLFLLASYLFSSAFANSHHSRKAESASPGEFDYYLLSLSWSPDYCATHPTAQECGGVKKFAFIAHGLWPEQNNGGYPENCGGPAFDPSQLPPGLDAVIPNVTLEQHEWQTHGTCSGLSENQFFTALENAFHEIQIPLPYQQPPSAVRVAPATLKQQFQTANPAIPLTGFSVQCSGSYLSEVRVCLDKGLKGRPCGSGVRDSCRAGTIILRPAR
jgi:ribonuclease T2